jgi:hypothetical protein
MRDRPWWLRLYGRPDWLPARLNPPQPLSPLDRSDVITARIGIAVYVLALVGYAWVVNWANLFWVIVPLAFVQGMPSHHRRQILVLGRRTSQQPRSPE